MDPMYIKAMNRRAIAYERKQRWDEALYGKSETIGGKPRHHWQHFSYTGQTLQLSVFWMNSRTTRWQNQWNGYWNRWPRFARKKTWRPGLIDCLPQDMWKPILIRSDQVKISMHVWIITNWKLSSIVDLDLPTTADEASGDYYFALAYRSTLNKNYATAREASEKAVALGCSPVYLPAAFNLKGTFAFLCRDANTALDCLSKAIKLDSSYVQCYIKRASIYIEQRKSSICTYAFFPSLLDHHHRKHCRSI